MSRIQQGNKKHLGLKRQLRQEMTQAEGKLWTKLRAKQFEGLKFRRQHGIGPWIVDFYCSQKYLVIEIDGDVHGKTEQVKKDQERTLYLKNLGLQVIRYNNDDILTNLDGVLEDLYQKLMQEDLPPLTPPYKGGENTEAKTINNR